MRQIPMDSVSHFVSRIFVRNRSTTRKHRSAPAKPNNNNNNSNNDNGATINRMDDGAPTPEENNKNNTPPTSSEPTAVITTLPTAPTTTTTITTATPDSFDSLDDVPASPITENSVNVNTLEFAASRDLAFFLDSGWSSSVKKSHDETRQKLSFPQFEYLLHDPKEDQEPQRPATSSGPPRRQRSIGQQFFTGTLPRKAKNLSLSRPKSAVNLIKRVRSTPNFKDQQQQQQQSQVV